MDQDTPVVARRANARRQRRHVAGLPLLLSLAVVLVRPPTVVHAVTPEAATIDVANMQAALSFPCRPCFTGLAGTSAGDIAGVDANNNPFHASWPGSGSVANLSGNMQVDADCGGGAGVVTGGDANGSFTVTGAVLVERNVQTGATITVTFVGNYDGDVLVSQVTLVQIAAGATQLSVTPLRGVGAVTMTPTPPITGCNGTQSYSMSGTFLTAA